MKINWGTGIVLAFIGFITFILYFVFRMTMEDRANHDLVTEEYYKKELSYQQDMNASRAATEMDANLKVEKTDEGLMVYFPERFDPKKITGTVSLYRPSDKHLDTDFPISLSKTHLLIPDNRLVDGRWDITIKWKYGGKDFFHKQKLIY